MLPASVLKLGSVSGSLHEEYVNLKKNDSDLYYLGFKEPTSLKL